MSPGILDAIKLIWADEAFQNTVRRIDASDTVFTHDSDAYYSSRLDRILSPEYVPTMEDILWCRKATTGFYTTQLTFQGMKYEVWDVGGQKSAIWKYIYTLDDVPTVLYTFDVTAYPKFLQDGDNSASRMDEQILLLQSLVESRSCREATIIIVLTKLDLLEDYLHAYPVDEYFEHYSCDHQSENEMEYFLKYIGERLESLVQSSSCRGQVFTVNTTLVDVDRRNPAGQILKIIY